jgi:hypothetical protein
MRLLYLSLLFSFIGCGNASDEVIESVDNSIQEQVSKDTSESKGISFKIFEVENKQFGYDIFVDGKIYIHQPHIPSIPGNKGFESKEDAIKVAELIKNKIENKIIPPTTSKAELDSLGVINN